MKRGVVLTALLIAAGGIAAGLWWHDGQRGAAAGWQGYVDADYVQVSPTLTGRLVSLSVTRGQTVVVGAPLFAQDDTDDRAARDAARGRLAQAEAQLENLMTASRQTEIAAAAANLAGLIATRDRIARDLSRDQRLLHSGGVSRQTVDHERADLATADAQVTAAREKLKQARSPTGRQYEITAQRAAVEQARAALQEATWRLQQRHVTAPVAGTVADVFARPGETIAAGTPVVSLLPPKNILVRFFVPETAFAHVHLGERLAIHCDACARDLTAKITFIAPQPEYTPPVIYSETTRAKLVYLIEAHPPADQAGILKPGQPVDVLPLAGTPP